MPAFIPGLKLNELFYNETVKPILDANFPGLRYSAALLGSGSDVLGFDTEMSTDHEWGPHFQLFLTEADRQRHGDEIKETLRHKLPPFVHNYSTHFTPPREDGTVRLDAPGNGPINHRIMTTTPQRMVKAILDFDLDDDIAPADWLTFGEQNLLSITAGAVYHDEIGLQAVRERFAYYPHDVWLYFLAAGWMRISQEEHLMPRAGYVGDELGSALIGSRLVRDVMRLCFLMEKKYAPYPKWFGTAFGRLDCAPRLMPILRQAQLAETWPEREKPLAAAYEILATMHNMLSITEKLRETATQFYGRPFKVMFGEEFARAIAAQIKDPAVLDVIRHIAPDDDDPQGKFIGGIDQFSDNTDLGYPHWRKILRQLYSG